MSKASKDQDYRAFYDATYVRAWDLPTDRDAIMTIERVEGVEIKGVDKTERRPVVYFKGAKKGLVLNKGMGKTVKGMYGARVGAWVGKMIALYATTVSAFGDTHDVIRIRPTIPTGRRTAPNKPAGRPELGPASIPDAEFENVRDEQEQAS